MATLPIVDLGAAADVVTSNIDGACTDTGFFAVVGHGVADDVIQHMWDATKSFFDLPPADKLAARHADPTHPYGYFPPGGEALSKSRGVDSPPDIKESFNLAPPAEHPDGTGRFGGVERIWPDSPTEFKTAWLTYYDSLYDLSERIMDVFAQALRIEPELFRSRTNQHLCALRGLNYPPLEHPPQPGQLRAGAHSDYGTLTVLLPGPGDGGLEVQSRAGAWIPVAPIDGAFVVNIGDMMQRWTNDRWRSTLHRVIIPDDYGERRQSIAFFHQPNWNAEIATLPSCITPDQPSKYEPVLAGPWLQAKFDRAAGAG